MLNAIQTRTAAFKKIAKTDSSNSNDQCDQCAQFIRMLQITIINMMFVNDNQSDGDESK